MRITGIVHRSDLGLFDIDEPARRRFLRRGLMERVGPRYVRSVAPPDLVDLLWQGVRATRVSAAPHHGLWTPLLEGRHVYRPRGVPELQESSDLVTHGNAMRSWPDRDPVASLELTLDHAARCLPVRDSAILFESALNSRRLSERDAQRIVAGLPSTRRHQLSHIFPLAEFGTETAVRWWPESLHVPVTAQVRVPGGGTLFQAQAEVRLPNDADPTELRGALERIAAELMVDLGLVDGDR